MNPALMEALEEARKRVETLEIEKAKALKRFEEQEHRWRTVNGKLREALDEIKALKKTAGGAR